MTTSLDKTEVKMMIVFVGTLPWPLGVDARVTNAHHGVQGVAVKTFIFLSRKSRK